MNAFKRVSVRIYILGFFEALMTAACYTATVLLVRPMDAGMFLDLEGGYLRIGLVALTFLIATYLFDLHRQPRPVSRLLLALQLSQLIGIILLVQAAFAFIDPDLVLPQDIILVGSALLLVVVVLWRAFLRPRVWASFGAQRVLFIGSSEIVEQLCAAFARDLFRGVEVAGLLVKNIEEVPPDQRSLGVPRDARDVVTALSLDRIIVEGDSIDDPFVLTELLDIAASGVMVETASQAYESEFSRVDCRGMHPYKVVFLNSLVARPAHLALQAVYTNLLALVAALVALPLILLIATAKKIFSRGPVLLTYRCIGLHGIPFRMYQFRCPAGGSFIDRFLRRYKLVALPQILNLVRGEIALLGPRPERAEIDDVLAATIPFYRQKQSVKPGLFGWSQLHCDALPEEDTLRRLEYDLYYIKHMSIALDIYIVLRALKWLISDERYSTDTRYAGDVLQGSQ